MTKRKKIKQLKNKFNLLQARPLAIGRAIERAAQSLPAGMSLTVEIEKNTVAVDVFVRSRLLYKGFDGVALSAEINTAVDYAIASAEGQQG